MYNEASYLVHSAKGTSWGKHKYIRKEGNKYIYKESDSKGKGIEIHKDTTDADIIKNSLGDDFDAVQKKVIAKQKETGRTNLTDDEIKEILGDKYDVVKERLTDQAAARSESTTNKPTLKSQAEASRKAKAAATGERTFTKSEAESYITNFEKKYSRAIGNSETLKKVNGKELKEYYKAKSVIYS